MEKRKQWGTERLLPVILIGICVAWAASLGLMCGAAAVCLRLELGAEGPALAVCALSCLVGGAAAAGLGRRRKLPVALAAAAGWFLVWLVIGGASGGEPDTGVALRHLAAGLAGGLLAGVFASRPKKSRK